MKETDLYSPLQTYFLGQGYQVSAEVLHTDMVISKDNLRFGIELKLKFSLELVYQLLRRRGMYDGLYAAVLIKKDTFPKHRDTIALMASLGFGLIGVRFLKSKIQIQVFLQANQGPTQLAIKHRARGKILQEIDGRFAELSPGGLPGSSVRLTAYRQQALFIVWLMNRYPQIHSPKDLRNRGTDIHKTNRILRDNVYGWFHKTARGNYSLSDAGILALENHREHIKVLEERWIIQSSPVGES